MKKCTKASVLLLLIILISHISFGQNQLYRFVQNQRSILKNPVEEVQIFSVVQDPSISAQLNSTLNGFILYDIQHEKVNQLFNQRPSSLHFIIPANNREYQLELVQHNINTSGDYKTETVGEGSSSLTVSHDQGLHYRGYINGDPNSIAGLSVFENGDVMIMFSNQEDNFSLGKIKNSKRYILVRNQNMRTPLRYECATSEETVGGGDISQQYNFAHRTEDVPPVLCGKIRLYWEASNTLYTYNFSSDTTLTKNYLQGVFNQVAIMYLNEGIKIELAATKIWRTLDPYNKSSSSTALNDFRSYWNTQGNNFNGDLAMIIDGGSSHNGGIAYLVSNFCSRTYNYAYSNVYGNYNSVPTYSWDVLVITHETGHNMGSHHTHWCGWMTGPGGSCGAIDNCYTLESSTGCTTCLATTNTNPPPLNFKGTVMSYCHLRTGIGINLALGFGPLPQAVIRNTVNLSDACLEKDNVWTGSVSTAWETPENWSCNSIPDETTDVVLPLGLTNYPVVSSAAVCRKLVQPTGTSVLVTQGFSLNIVGNQ